MEKLNTFAAIVQALTGIAALILSIVVAFQSTKIQELTDIARELNKQSNELRMQNEIMAESLNLEKAQRIKETSGYFVKSSQSGYSYGNGQITLYLLNIGQQASNLRICGSRTNPKAIDISKPDVVMTNEAFTINVVFGSDSNSQFDFDLRFDNQSGIQCKQRIFVGGYSFIVEPPKIDQ